ncbi:MAG: hypothetical protein M3Q97_08555, partial [Bacteroidota bacterium]|nr:hypothetical protein [Bacteroidota bacterium]
AHSQSLVNKVWETSYGLPLDTSVLWGQTAAFDSLGNIVITGNTTQKCRRNQSSDDKNRSEW